MTRAEAFRRYDGDKTSYRWRGGRIASRGDAPNGIWYLVARSRGIGAPEGDWDR